MKFEAEIILESVSEPEVPEMPRVYRSYLEHLTEQVERQLSERGVGKEARVSIEVLKSKLAVEILQYADENNVGLITPVQHHISPFGTAFQRTFAEARLTNSWPLQLDPANPSLAQRRS